MKRTQFCWALIVATLSTGLLYSPAPTSELSLSNAVSGAQRSERDFFEIGIEQFEREIERLQEPAPETPLLTLDESVQFDNDAQELEFEQPSNDTAIPETVDE